MSNIPSKILEQAVEEISNLPGIGKRTSLRLALHLLKWEKGEVERLAKSLTKLRNDITYCSICHNISNTSVCEICNNTKRDKDLICVVEDIRDVMAIENTTQYKGVYHILGGVISPMEGVGPDDLNISSLIARTKDGTISEIIFALSATIEGDTTSYYIYKQLKQSVKKVSVIARGVAIGDNLEYADEITLARSIQNRLPFEIE